MSEKRTLSLRLRACRSVISFLSLRKQIIPRNSRGIALLIVMWVIIILFVIVTEFCFTMRSELTITKNLKEETECYYLAYAGVQAAFYELLSSFNNVYRDAEGNLILEDKSKSQISHKDANTGDTYIERLDVKPPRRTAIPLGRGYFSYLLTDEDSKVNINRVVRADNRPGTPYQSLRTLFLNSGVEPGVVIDTIMDSIIDWRDSNKEHHLNGAEDDWYEANYRQQGYDHPYKAKNGSFDTVEELLMVRGITKEILYGTEKARQLFGPDALTDPDSDEILYTGVIQFISVFNVGRRINRNTASDAVIEAMYPETATEILMKRETNNGRYNDRLVSSYYTIISTGYLPYTDTIHTIRVTVWRRGRGSNANLQMQFWKDNEFELFAPIQFPSDDPEDDNFSPGSK
ncbi:general secretion pathway protein GspK [candidate division CSSED10-310 bacterium]|uniref:General secretion pathway protein GspK n=1 Tax=candidate division CSSED10-310 bacterium TaxID=2855610 RepID=A0ABV6YZU1_UNCC1